MGLPPNMLLRVSKVRADGGRVGARKSIPPSVRARLETRWREVLAEPTGAADYAAFREYMAYQCAGKRR